MYFGNYTIFSLFSKIDGEGSALALKSVNFVPFVYGTINTGKIDDTEPLLRLYFDDFGASVMYWLANYLAETKEQAELLFSLCETPPKLYLLIRINRFPFKDFSDEFGLKPKMEAILGETNFTAFIAEKIQPTSPLITRLWESGQRDFSVTISQFDPRYMRVIKEDIGELPTKPAEIISQRA